MHTAVWGKAAQIGLPATPRFAWRCWRRNVMRSEYIASYIEYSEKVERQLREAASVKEDANVLRTLGG